MRQAERILSEGASGLPDAELLRVVLGARDELLACRLLSRGLPSLRRAGPGELLLESGMSAALAARVMAALELGRRVALAPRPGAAASCAPGTSPPCSGRASRTFHTRSSGRC